MLILGLGLILVGLILVLIMRARQPECRSVARQSNASGRMRYAHTAIGVVMILRFMRAELVEAHNRSPSTSSGRMRQRRPAAS